MNCNKFTFIRSFLLSTILSLFFISDVFTKELQSKFQDWSVFKTNRGDKDICYMASTPIKSRSYIGKRGEPYFLVTNIANDADEISAVSGFVYKEKSNVELSFGSKQFYLFPFLTISWANDKNEDIDIIKQMQKSDEMIVTGVSKEGKIVHDSYSLIGFVQAYREMKGVCRGYYQEYFVKYDGNNLSERK